MIARLLIIVAAMLGSIAVGAQSITVGAARTSEYIPMLRGKRVAVLANHTAIVDTIHTVDLMLRWDVDVRLILSPEHGFRGTAAEGEAVANSIDTSTGLPIYSLYGRRKGAARLSDIPRDIDVIVCDIQDVGLRFYTYYINMIEMMEYALANGLEFVVLDRPNPLGMMVDGPILDPGLRSGVGRLPIPVIHGLTLGEMAQMAYGEQWLDGQTSGSILNLTVIPCLGYTHSSRYELPVAPSPNLRTMQAIYLYPSICLFEGTIMSLGRGTDNPFTLYGHPSMTGTDFSFTPRRPANGSAPVLAGKLCHGVDLSDVDADSVIARGVDLSYVIDAYHNRGMRCHSAKFFTPFFDKLIGQRYVRRMIEQGKSAGEIKALWANDVEQFQTLRSRYLLYPL